MSFAQKAALVTGGGLGMGASAALLLGAAGCAVAVVDMNTAHAERVAGLIQAGGGRALAITADIMSEADNVRAFASAVAAFGGLDYAFLNAGGQQKYAPFEEMSVETFDRMIALNLRGPYLGVREALKTLRPGGAAVVNASTAAFMGFPEATGYATAKHGVVGLVRSAARAFAHRKLRLNAVCPGIVATPLNGLPQNDEIVPVDQLPIPEDRGIMSAQHVAEVVLFLLSPAAAGVNGQAQFVDAALLAAFPPLAAS